MACGIILFACSCGGSADKGSDTTMHAPGKKSHSGKKEKDIIENPHTGETTLLFDKAAGFSEEQKQYLMKYNTPPTEWLAAGDTLEGFDSLNNKKTIIIQAKFGTY